MQNDRRVAVVTGAGGRRGIGRAIALRFAQQGFDLALIDVPNQDASTQQLSEWRGVDSVCEEVAALGRRAIAVRADVSDATQVQDAFDHIVSEFGQVDVLVNNARATLGKDRVPVADLDPLEWDRVMNVGARGTFLCSQATARHLVERRKPGNIVNISSVAGRRGVAGQAAYSASKSVVNSLTQTLALELGQYNIRVNSLCPGLVDTDRTNTNEDIQARDAGITLAELRQRQFSAHRKLQVLSHIATAEDVAGVAVFLISNDARHITGQCINVCGGEFPN